MCVPKCSISQLSPLHHGLPANAVMSPLHDGPGERTPVIIHVSSIRRTLPLKSQNWFSSKPCVHRVGGQHLLPHREILFQMDAVPLGNRLPEQWNGFTLVVDGSDDRTAIVLLVSIEIWQRGEFPRLRFNESRFAVNGSFLERDLVGHAIRDFSLSRNPWRIGELCIQTGQ
jgi:hypothetical protein